MCNSAIGKTICNHDSILYREDDFSGEALLFSEAEEEEAIHVLEERYIYFDKF